MSCGVIIHHDSRCILKDAWAGHALCLDPDRGGFKLMFPIENCCLINSDNFYVSISCSNRFTIFSYNEGFLVTRETNNSLPLHLQKYKKYDLKKNIHSSDTAGQLKILQKNFCIFWQSSKKCYLKIFTSALYMLGSLLNLYLDSCWWFL